MNKVEKDRLYRLKNQKYIAKQHGTYRKTFGGKIVHMYQGMKSRVLYGKDERYLGLPILKRLDFYNFALNNEALLYLYVDWVDSGYTKSLSPSVNRIDPAKGYLLNNIEFITCVENQRLGGYNKRGKKKL